jgi:two-component system, OmpR family, phosphate regulon response regulator PhoB
LAREVHLHGASNLLEHGVFVSTAATTATPHGTTAKRVLVVEDDQRLRRLLTHYLRRVGYVVDEASDGAEGLARMASTVPDVVVLDLMMPGIGGVEFMAACRGDPRLMAVPVVVYSGAPADEESATQLGARAYLMKPVDLDVLRAVVERVSTS